MSTLFVDSHCHLDMIARDTGNDVDAIVIRAQDAGVKHMLCVAVTLDAFPEILAIAHRHYHVYASVGVHPNEQPAKAIPVDDLMRLAADPKVIAIGETGLDYFRSEGDIEWQRDRFRAHIAAAKAMNKPLIVHCREAKEDTLKILKEEGADQVGGVMHCFVEDWETAKRSMDLNFHISFSGIVTFKNATALREVAAQVPKERLLIETDSPYLAPVPFRGRPNEPAFVKHVAAQIAALRETSVEEIAETTSANFFNLFPTKPPVN